MKTTLLPNSEQEYLRALHLILELNASKVVSCKSDVSTYNRGQNYVATLQLSFYLALIKYTS